MLLSLYFPMTCNQGGFFTKPHAPVSSIDPHSVEWQVARGGAQARLSRDNFFTDAPGAPLPSEVGTP